MIDEPFSRGRTALHKADPRAKIIGAAALTTVMAVAGSYPAAVAGLAFSAVLVLASLPAPGKLARRVLAVNGFILFLWISLPLTMPGPEMARLGPLSLTQTGISTAALITIKCNAVVLALAALIATSPAPDLGHALIRIGVPAKLCFLLLFCYRHLDVIADEYKRLARSAKARSFTPRTNMHTYRTVAYMTGMVLVRALDRSRRVHQAMLLRGFDGRFHRLSANRTGPADAALAAGLLLAAACLAWIESMY